MDILSDKPRPKYSKTKVQQDQSTARPKYSKTKAQQDQSTDFSNENLYSGHSPKNLHQGQNAPDLTGLDQQSGQHANG